jgi:hypothetical protein
MNKARERIYGLVFAFVFTVLAGPPLLFLGWLVHRYDGLPFPTRTVWRELKRLWYSAWNPD